MKTIVSNIFSSLKIRNFKLYFFAQLISLSGTWMQGIALSWLAYEITGLGTSLGLVLSLQYLPLLFFGIFGGFIIDKLPKYESLFITQFLYSLIPFLVAYLIFTGNISIWWLYLASLWQGIMRILDNPLRQSFISYIVDKENIKNAVTLYSISSNIARIIGPVLAGLVLAKFGAGWCFLLNALSFFFVIFMLYLMKREQFFLNYDKEESRGIKLKDSLLYVWENKIVRDTLLVAALFGTFILTFQTSFPIFTKTIFNKGVVDYSLLVSAYGFGSIIGGLYAAQDKRLNKTRVRNISLILSLVYCLLSFSPSYSIFILFVFLVGFFSIQALTTANALTRLHSENRYLGMVTALWSMSTIGMGAVGSLYIGIVSDLFGARVSTFLAGLFLFFFVLVFYREKTVKKNFEASTTNTFTTNQKHNIHK